MKQPLVTIICICYNHEKYVKDAIMSVWDLDYPNVELIVADDASSDNSQEVIRTLTDGKNITLLLNEKNIGHCKTFNKALKASHGEFVIDLAADDILNNGGVCEGIEHLLEKGDEYGCFYADADFIDAHGKEVGEHDTASYFRSGKAPEGDIYTAILGKYFINPPTIVCRKSILDQLEGYDEALAYEDFDFWVRSSRITKYCHSSLKTVKKRMLDTSASSYQYVKNSKMLVSTLEVCRKAFKLNRNRNEDMALLKRLSYESKMAFASSNYWIGLKMMLLFGRVLIKIRT